MICQTRADRDAAALFGIAADVRRSFSSMNRTTEMSGIRAFRSFSRQRARIVRTVAGTEGGSRVKSGSARRIAASVSEMLSPSSPDAARREPVDGSNARAREHLVEHTAERPDVAPFVGRAPFTCSGLMYNAVPRITPARVAPNEECRRLRNDPRVQRHRTSGRITLDVPNDDDVGTVPRTPPTRRSPRRSVRLRVATVVGATRPGVANPAIGLSNRLSSWTNHCINLSVGA